MLKISDPSTLAKITEGSSRLTYCANRFRKEDHKTTSTLENPVYVRPVGDLRKGFNRAGRWKWKLRRLRMGLFSQVSRPDPFVFLPGAFSLKLGIYFDQSFLTASIDASREQQQHQQHQTRSILEEQNRAVQKR